MKTKHIFRIPVLIGWIVACFAILIAKIKGKVPSVDYDIIRVATMQSGERSIVKAQKLLGFKPKYYDISSGLADCYFKD